jgi:replicative DNA helicase
MGKTSLALNVAEHVAVQLRQPVALFSLEMSKLELAQRLMCSVAGIDQGRLRTGQLANDDWPKLSGAVDVLSDAPFYIDDSAGVSVLEIRSKARRLEQQTGQKLGLVVVDYLQLMTQPGGSENRVQEISQISRALKVLGRDLDVPVLALSQLSRAVEQRQDKRPILSDLRESGSIEQDADVVMFIYRDSYYRRGEDGDGLAQGVGGLAVVVLVAVDEHHEVGVLLDRPRLAQVREDRPLDVTLLDSARELRKRDDRHVEIAGQHLERALDLRHLLHAVLGGRARGHQL